MTRRRVVAGSWCQLDFQVDVTVDGRQVRFLNIIDEYTREALATTAARSFTADATIAVLDQVIAGTGRRPTHIRMDNGPELTAHALIDWCRFTGGCTGCGRYGWASSARTP